MASLDSLPPDQRAVLQLVLERGRTYDEIAVLLSIDRAHVRQRALAAFDLLGPETHVDSERRHLLTDYLLGQLPSKVAEETRSRLAASPGERAWARVLASELAPVAGGRLPEIPTEDSRAPDRARAAKAPETTPEAGAKRAPASEPTTRPSSRVGGAILLGVGGLIAVVVVVVVLLSGSSSPKKRPSTSATSPITATTGTSTTPARVVAQINLNSPSGAKTPKGAAQVVKQGVTTGIIIVASGVAANTKHDAYAVWLVKPAGPGRILGFVNPGVGPTGRLQTVGPLPADATQYTQLLVTRENQANPKNPGTIILQGDLKLTG